MRALGLAAAILVVPACGDDGGGGADDDDDDGGAIDAPVGPIVDAPPAADAGDCEPPDMLIVLDRTMSMHRRPDGSRPNDAEYTESKWYLAIDALETVTADLDGTIRFGLELFPQDPGGDQCVTLSQRINDITATNPQCEMGEVLVPPALSTSGAIDAELDPQTTLLCRSTPIGAGLETAETALAAAADPIRDQYALLLTDGQDTCDEPLVLDTAHSMADAGVGLFVIGFDATGTGVDNGLLNDLACAGGTAPDPATDCVDDGTGNQIAADRDGPALYLLAESAAGLSNALMDVAGTICCDCIE